MRSGRPIIAGMLAISLLLSSCVTSHDINVEVSGDQFAASSYLQGDVTAEVGDKIRIRLSSNHSTGFKWDYAMVGDSVVKEEDHDFDEHAQAVPGAAGIEVFTFETVARGEAEIHMDYSQPWEGGRKAERTYTLAVTVN